MHCNAKRLREAGLRFTVANHAGYDQIRIVKSGPVGVSERIAKLTPFMNGAWRLGGRVAWHSARKRELAEQSPHASDILSDLRVDFAVGSLEIGIGHHGRARHGRDRKYR